MSEYGIFGISVLIISSIIGGIVAAISARGKHYDKDGIMH